MRDPDMRPGISESTVERTTEDAGRRLADAVAAGATFGPQVDWPWPKDYQHFSATGS